MRQSVFQHTRSFEDSMMRLHRFCTFALLFALSGCGAGETAATASLQAEQAKQAQQQMEQLKQQIDQANAASTQRLQQAIDQAQ
jgi:cell division protein FtsB